MLSIEKIREERKKQGLSQWRLAVRVNRSGPWLGLREAGYVEANQDELEALSEALQQPECQQPECRATVGGAGMNQIETLNRHIFLKRQGFFLINGEIRLLRAKRDIARALEFLESRITADDDTELSRTIDCATVVSEYLETI